MGILSRFQREHDVTQSYSLPPSIHNLYQTLPKFGTLYDRKSFFAKVLPRHEQYVAEYAGFKFGVRPSWQPYHHNPRTHLIVVGHVLFVYVKEGPMVQQPSVRLFEETPGTRTITFHQLLSVGKKCRLGS